MGMYSDVHTNVSGTVKIMGFPFYAENINGDEPVNRRERDFTPILGGTERVSEGKYIHREFNFTTTIFFPTGRPDAYDSTFEKMMSKPVEVISPYMGKTPFKALINISKVFPESSPNHMELDITVTEVPDRKSLIPGESFKVPVIKKIKTKVKSINSKSNKSSSSSSKSSSRKNVPKKNK